MKKARWEAGVWMLMMLALGGTGAASQEHSGMLERVDLSTIDPADRFDFALGSWTYSFPGGGGEVTYAPAVDGTVMRETLEGEFGGQRFAGSSLTFYDAEAGTWNRRWIDSFGNVIQASPVMTEYEASDLPVMMSTFQLGDIWFKHVWYDITADRFETDLLVSQDGGQSYQLSRRAPYERVR